MYGKKFRMFRITDPDTKRMIIIPIDHPISRGPMTGIEKPKEIVQKLVEGGANAMVVHPGWAKNTIDETQGKIGVIMKLTNAAMPGYSQHSFSSVENAIKLGADAVSVTCLIGEPRTEAMLEILGEAAVKCDDWGIPLLAMMYPVKSKDIPDPMNSKFVKRAARIGAELGADIVKTHYTGSVESLREVTETCPVPVITAGGAKMDDLRQMLQIAGDVIKGGGSGICFGRNVWQQDNPTAILKALSKVVHEGASVDDAMVELK